MNNHYLHLRTLAATAALALLGACSQVAHKPVADCSLSDTNNVDRLFAEAATRLETKSCQYAWPGYQQRLVRAAKGAPGAENEARFASLLRQAIDEGVISKRQGQEVFSRYFDPEFYAVKSDARSSCSSLRNKDKLMLAMREELADKREGMLEILNDETRFRQAQRYYQDLGLVFDAVQAACTQDI